ncbi:cyclic nucleotide-binding domain-containing protein [Streptacidiphilus sp. PB12-B1b]|uniref:family 2B encapsulin nanocompartment shell protein n=1 Tax=Streptacidiphilus sp. PB12-B1b TaxID=2705012 RepID=UPI0015F7C130|nr:family 2B encapsulin nanocompartment shell protein [Streptacidiphilus sp. PB12-B1b]QMU74911.1 cyclic nucleotide-binding domain-containing protein [Streptacidiphilus sp. PB12-B1b]
MTEEQTALGTAAAKNLATTTKTPPQMQGITSRWLLKMLPWVQVTGGTYRVNRRLTYATGRGRLSFAQTGSEVRIVPPTLAELPVLRGLDDQVLLTELAARFSQREFEPGEVVAERGAPVDHVLVVAHGKIRKIGDGKFGDHEAVLGTLANGDHFGDEALTEDGASWDYTAKAATSGTLLVLPRAAFTELAGRSEALRAQVDSYLATAAQAQDRHGQAEIPLAAGHEGEPELPGSFVDYELSPREYELSVAQTVLQVHTRVADLYNHPMNQIEQQLKLTVEALRERQEHELINSPDFGLLANADHEQRIQTHGGPPTPDDMDELLSRRRGSRLFLAHPRAIAAFGRECNKRGLYPDSVDVEGHRIPSWRGVPIFPCSKIPVNGGHTSSILVLRTGEDNQGVVGLHQTGLPDEYEPGLSVRFMGINEKAVIQYLVSTYFSAAVLVPDALGVLENVEVAHPRD